MAWFDKYKKDFITTVKKISAKDIELLRAKTSGDHRTTFVIGNGGSSANSDHFAEDMSFCVPMKNAGASKNKVVSLSNTPMITAIGNDVGYKKVFVEQLKIYSKPWDVLLGISVSGTSPNLVGAFTYAKRVGMYCIALTGEQARNNPQSICSLADFSLVVPSRHYGIVEDVQMFILHSVVYSIVEEQ